MRRFYVIARRLDGGAGPLEVSEDDARAKHEAGGEVHYSDEGGPMLPVPRVVVEPAAEVQPAEPVKKAKKG